MVALHVVRGFSLAFSNCKNMLKNFLSKWKQLSVKAGNFQATVVLTIFYFLIITPFAIIIKIFTDPLNLTKKSLTWNNKESKEENIKKLKEQF